MITPLGVIYVHIKLSSSSPFSVVSQPVNWNFFWARCSTFYNQSRG